MAQRARWITGIGLLGLLLFGPGLYQQAHLSFIQWRLDRRLRELSAQHEQLTQEQAKLQSDPTYVEGLIRSTFKWAQPGEYVIPQDPSQSSRKAR